MRSQKNVKDNSEMPFQNSQNGKKKKTNKNNVDNFNKNFHALLSGR